jgi:hypothetical protein
MINQQNLRILHRAALVSRQNVRRRLARNHLEARLALLVLHMHVLVHQRAHAERFHLIAEALGRGRDSNRRPEHAALRHSARAFGAALVVVAGGGFWSGAVAALVVGEDGRALGILRAVEEARFRQSGNCGAVARRFLGAFILALARELFVGGNGAAVEDGGLVAGGRLARLFVRRELPDEHFFAADHSAFFSFR